MIHHEAWFKEADKLDQEFSRLQRLIEDGDADAFRQYLILAQRSGRFDISDIGEDLPPGMEEPFKDFLKGQGPEFLSKVMQEYTEEYGTDLSTGMGPVLWEAYTEWITENGRIPLSEDEYWVVWDVDLLNWIHEEMDDTGGRVPDDYYRVYWGIGEHLAEQDLGWGNIPRRFVEWTPEQYLPSIPMNLSWEVYMPEGPDNPYGDEHVDEGSYGEGLGDPEDGYSGPRDMNIKEILNLLGNSGHWEDLTGEGNLFGHYNAEIYDTNGWFEENYPGYSHVRAYLSFPPEGNHHPDIPTLGQKVIQWIQEGQGH